MGDGNMPLPPPRSIVNNKKKARSPVQNLYIVFR